LSRPIPQLLLADNAANVFDFDTEKLVGISRQIGPSMAEILTAPATDEYLRGDVRKPVF
jgi:hypothetical protein